MKMGSKSSYDGTNNSLGSAAVERLKKLQGDGLVCPQPSTCTRCFPGFCTFT